MFRILSLFCFFLITFNLSAQESNDNCTFKLPNAHTPNCGDENGCPLIWECACEVVELDFKLFNRWGQLIYETAELDKTTGFDPHAKDKKNSYAIPTGVYFWQAKYTVMVDDQEKELKTQGNITFMR